MSDENDFSEVLAVILGDITQGIERQSLMKVESSSSTIPGNPSRGSTLHNTGRVYQETHPNEDIHIRLISKNGRIIE